MTSRYPLLLIPLLLALTGAVGTLVCAVAGVGMHQREMLAAAAVMLGASLVATLVWRKVRLEPQPVVAQGALVGISLHMIVALALCGVVYVVGVPIGAPFALWLLTFYFATLIVLAAAFVRIMKTAPRDVARH